MCLSTSCADIDSTQQMRWGGSIYFTQGASRRHSLLAVPAMHGSAGLFKARAQLVAVILIIETFPQSVSHFFKRYLKHTLAF